MNNTRSSQNDGKNNQTLLDHFYFLFRISTAEWSFQRSDFAFTDRETYFHRCLNRLAATPFYHSKRLWHAIFLCLLHKSKLVIFGNFLTTLCLPKWLHVFIVISRENPRNMPRWICNITASAYSLSRRACAHSGPTYC